MTEYQWDQSARIRCLRDYLGFSVAEIAAALNVGVRSYQNFESGKAAIPTGVLDDVADLVHRLDELAGSYSTQDSLSIDGLTRFEMRAAGIAAAAVPELRIEP
jgi:hypothetical protein